jgi:DNA gyrase subunit A
LHQKTFSCISENLKFFDIFKVKTMTQQNTAEIIPISIKKEMENSYLDYAMSVIVSRAIPDVRDGLKPVHRRIIYSMSETSCHYNRPYRKSARIVGDVMGKYHPHGDSAIYDSLVRMAQPFSLRLPLVDGQGNFGSMDGDSPAAMRYTESRMAKAAHALTEDLDKDTTDWQDNYDGTEKEPKVLPSRFPNLLVNGAGGIAVGMATNIPPHNLGEVIDATIALMNNPEITVDELIEIVPAPDFPTGGMILGRTGSISALQTGRGSVVIRGRAEIQENNNREAIIITEIPYQVNKAHMVEKIADLVREKKIEGISDLRDESDKSGVRVVVEIKRDAMASVVLNQLYKFTPLQTSFGVNLLALDRGRPRQMNLRDVLVAFVDFREEVIARRTNFELNKARDRAHILIGLSLAVANIDAVIAIIRNSPDANTARKKLMTESWPAETIKPLIELVDDHNNVVKNGKCSFTKAQAKAILDMKLSRLTGLEHEKITKELNELAEHIKNYLDILASRERIREIIKTELIEVKTQFATPRMTTIEASEFEEDIEDLIAKEDMVVTVTVGGYIKRVPLSTYRAQRRGGKGRMGLSMKDEDVTNQVFVANTHTPMLFFSTKGKAYKLKAYKLPLGNPQSKGRSLVNIFPLETGETINVIMPLPENEADWQNLQIIFATSHGNIRKNKLSDFESVRANGKIAMKLEGDEELIGVSVCNENQHILLASYQGKALRCPTSAVRVFQSRNSTGVRGMALAKGDKVISMTILNGADKDIETRDKYLNLATDARVQIAKLATIAEPKVEGEIVVESKPIKDVTIESLRAAGKNTEADEIEKLCKESGSDLSVNTIISYARNEEFILTITENGYGKRSSAYEYRITSRGGKGVVNIITSDRNGNVVASFPVLQNDQIMLITNSGKLIRTHIKDIRIAGRNTQGVTLFRVDDAEKIVSSARIPLDEQAPEIEDSSEETGEEVSTEQAI